MNYFIYPFAYTYYDNEGVIFQDVGYGANTKPRGLMVII